MAYIPQDRTGGFLMITGVTFLAFASGFGVCMFNLDTVGSCVAVADSWFSTFLAIGSHLIAWGIQVVHGVFAR